MIYLESIYICEHLCIVKIMLIFAEKFIRKKFFYSPNFLLCYLHLLFLILSNAQPDADKVQTNRQTEFHEVVAEGSEDSNEANYVWWVCQTLQRTNLMSRVANFNILKKLKSRMSTDTMRLNPIQPNPTQLN